jgi:tetratricopeptide (TPR) repeat protein
MRSLILAASCFTLPLLAQSTRPAGDPAQLKKLDPAYQRANGCMAPESSAIDAMPLIDGLAKVSFPLAAASPQAQRYFDQGLALLYGFEYEKAERSFAQGAALDPECAMCLWGQALAIGPYQNSGPMSEADRARAKALTERALASPKLSAKERALAQALDLRYAPAPPSDDARGVHGVRYAEALAAAAQAYPTDDVVVVLAGQAAMEVRPWDYWQADKQTPLPWGARALKLIETVLARNPDQPQAQHLYIHLTEASLSPGKAERAADMLEVAAPASAHLVHMPSHTFYRVGRFDAAIRANRRAIEVDDAMGARLGEAKPHYGYFRHHMHFIVATAAEMLALPEPTGDKPVLRQIWRALRAEALGREGRIDEAQQELKWMRLERLRVELPDEAMPVVRIAEMVAVGRMNFGSKNYRGAATRLARAAELEAKIPYREPPAWHQPVDAAVGAALLKAGDARGALAAFRRALERRPGSPWVLWGLAQAQTALGDAAGAKASLALVDKSWAGDRKWLVLERL